MATLQARLQLPWRCHGLCARRALRFVLLRGLGIDAGSSCSFNVIRPLPERAFFAERGEESCASKRQGWCPQKEKGGQLRLPTRSDPRLQNWGAAGRLRRRPLRESYSNFSVITGNCSLALASDFTTVASAFSAEVLRAVAISLTSKYLARSSIFFSRKERGLLRLRETRLLRTTATSRREPVRMRSEFSLKRCFQSWWELSLPFSRNPRTLLASLERITERSPTASAFDCGTMTRNPLETMRIMK